MGWNPTWGSSRKGEKVSRLRWCCLALLCLLCLHYLIMYNVHVHKYNVHVYTEPLTFYNMYNTLTHVNMRRLVLVSIRNVMVFCTYIQLHIIVQYTATCQVNYMYNTGVCSGYIARVRGHTAEINVQCI